MDLGEFFKPTWIKCGVFAILAFMNFLFIAGLSIIVVDGGGLEGFPLAFYPVGSAFCDSAARCINVPVFSGVNFVLDLAIWYLAGCIIAFGFQNSRGSSK